MIFSSTMKKILLVEPPFNRLYNENLSLDKFPLSLGYLSSAIKKKSNWDVLAYNADFAELSINYTLSYLTNEGYKNYINNLNDLSYKVWKEVRSAIIDYQPDIVGISSKSQNFTSACNVAGLCKEINENITVIIGGPHPSLVGNEVMDCKYIDIAVRGEGEDTIVELLKAFENNGTYDNIDGIIYKDGKDIIENSPRALINDLDKIEFPYKYSTEVLKDYQKYPLRAFRSIFAIRGCPYNCTFCGSGKIWMRKVRFRSVKNVTDEINQLRERGINYFNFDDDTFGVSFKYIKELCEAIKKYCPGIKWSCELHVKLINNKTVSLMRSAGCDMIKIGIESGNNVILKENRKAITIEEAIDACKIVRKHNVYLMAFFMFGFPQDTEETIQDTINTMKKIPGFITYSIFTPYKGTDAYDLCEKYKLIPDNFDVSIYNHQSPANCFCINITHKRLREILIKVEKIVDRKNWLYTKKIILYKFAPGNILRRIKDYWAFKRKII